MTLLSFQQKKEKSTYQNFNKELKITVPQMGKIRSLSKSTKAKDILGWNPRPAEESILYVANQIKEMGLIK